MSDHTIVIIWVVIPAHSYYNIIDHIPYAVYYISVIIYFNWKKITLLWLFCHISTWIGHRYTTVNPPSTSLHPIPLGCPRAPALGSLLHAWNLHWSSVLHTVIYMFQCYSLKSSHPRPLPESKSLFSTYVSPFAVLHVGLLVLNYIYICIHINILCNYLLHNWRSISLNSFTNFTPSLLATIHLSSVLQIYLHFVLVYSVFRFYRHLSFPVWLIAFSTVSSRSIYTVTNSKASFFNGWLAFDCVQMHNTSLSIHVSIYT